MPKSELFHMVAGIVEAQAQAYKAADPDTRTPRDFPPYPETGSHHDDTPTPAPEPRQRVTEAHLAQAEAAAAIVKAARKWERHIGSGTEGTAQYVADAHRLAWCVDTYNALLGKGE